MDVNDERGCGCISNIKLYVCNVTWKMSSHSCHICRLFHAYIVCVICLTWKSSTKNAVPKLLMANYFAIVQSACLKMQKESNEAVTSTNRLYFVLMLYTNIYNHFHTFIFVILSCIKLDFPFHTGTFFCLVGISHTYVYSFKIIHPCLLPPFQCFLLFFVI